MMDEDFPKLMTKSKQQIQKSQRKLSRINAYPSQKKKKNHVDYVDISFSNLTSKW